MRQNNYQKRPSLLPVLWTKNYLEFKQALNISIYLKCSEDILLVVAGDNIEKLEIANFIY